MRRPSVISLFSGAGGLDLGAHAAGLRTAVAIELDATCCRTLRANRSRERSWEVIEAPIEEVSSRGLLRAAGLRKGEADLLIGGPPCQPFSKSGYWHAGDSARLNDPRARTLLEYLRVLQEARPRAFLLENVTGIGFSGKEEGLELIREKVEGLGYSLSAAVLNAADFGVPQVRQRYFVIGHREGRPFEFPKPTFGQSDGQTDLLGGLEPHRTAWDALGDLGEPEDLADTRVRGKYARLLPSIPEGQNYLWHTPRNDKGKNIFAWRSRYWSFLLKLAKTRPSWTLTASPGPSIGPFHWENRRLARRELARLQTFPDDYVLEGSLADVQRQIGNAVPSLLAEVLVREIRKQLLGHRCSPEPTLLRPSLGQPPGPERTKPVPAEYDDHIGDHPDHPGTGKGPGALRRIGVLG